MVCGAVSWFTQVTVLPVLTVIDKGSNAKFLIVMVFPPPMDMGVAVDAGWVWLEAQPATVQARITRMIHYVQNIRREFVGIMS